MRNDEGVEREREEGSEKERKAKEGVVRGGGGVVQRKYHQE